MFNLEAFPSQIVAQRFRATRGVVAFTELRSYTELTNVVAKAFGYDRKLLDEGAGETGRQDHDWTAYTSTNKKCVLIRWAVPGGHVLLALGSGPSEFGKKVRYWLAGLADATGWPHLMELSVQLRSKRAHDDLRTALTLHGGSAMPQRCGLVEQYAELWFAMPNGALPLPKQAQDEAWEWLEGVALRSFDPRCPPLELMGRHGGELQAGDRLLELPLTPPANDLHRYRANEPLPEGVREVLARNSVRRAQEMFDVLLTPHLAQPPSSDEIFTMLTPCAEGTLGGWARERFLQLNMTIVNPPQVADTQAVFSQPFREATGAGLIGTQDPKQDGPVPAPGSQDLIFAVVRETLTLARSEAKPTRSFLDGFGGDGPPPGLGFLTRPIRRPYYLPLRGLPCRLDRQAIVWRKGEDIALAVDFGVRDRTVIFGRLAPQVRRGRT